MSRFTAEEEDTINLLSILGFKQKSFRHRDCVLSKCMGIDGPSLDFTYVVDNASGCTITDVNDGVRQIIQAGYVAGYTDGANAARKEQEHYGKKACKKCSKRNIRDICSFPDYEEAQTK